MSNNIEDSLKMKTVDFQWFFVATDENTDMGVTQHDFVFVRAVNMEFNVTGKLTAVISTERTTTGADLYEVKKMLQSMDAPIQKLAGLERQVWSRGTVECLRSSPTM
jgi:hypothetical protein